MAASGAPPIASVQTLAAEGRADRDASADGQKKIGEKAINPSKNDR
jgi:hypothetical protein